MSMATNHIADFVWRSLFLGYMLLVNVTAPRAGLVILPLPASGAASQKQPCPTFGQCMRR